MLNPPNDKSTQTDRGSFTYSGNELALQSQP